MDNTPQIADIWKCEWTSGITGDSGTKYFLILDKVGSGRGWKVWSYHRNREEIRELVNISNEVVTSIYSKVA